MNCLRSSPQAHFSESCAAGPPCLAVSTLQCRVAETFGDKGGHLAATLAANVSAVPSLGWELGYFAVADKTLGGANPRHGYLRRPLRRRALAMALPLARLLLPALPACQCQPRPHLRFPKRHVSFFAPTTASSRGHRAAFAAWAAASAPAVSAPEAPEAEAEEVLGPRTRLVAQNIPWDCTADDMRALFGKHGSVAGVELSMYSASKNRGLAFVTMGSEEEALAALSNLNSTILKDRKINVDFARPRKKQPKQPVVVSDSTEKYVVFVGNLTWRVRNRHLRELFASAPGVVSAEVIFHTTTPRRSAGYAFVSFSSKETAEAAISTFNGQKLMGRPINVMFKSENAKKSESSVPKEEEAEVKSSEQSDR